MPSDINRSAIEFPCPKCKAEVGAPCVTAKGVKAYQYHMVRRPVRTIKIESSVEIAKRLAGSRIVALFD